MPGDGILRCAARGSLAVGRRWCGNRRGARRSGSAGGSRAAGGRQAPGRAGGAPRVRPWGQWPIAADFAVRQKGHLAITDRYPLRVRHQLVELGYGAAAAATARRWHSMCRHGPPGNG
ncbi:hypothetical protein M8494_15550 [Serratia ureilytica]